MMKSNIFKMKRNTFNYFRLKIYHYWKAFLRNQRHPFFRRLYANDNHWFTPKLVGPVIVPTFYGFKMIIAPDSNEIISRSLYYNGTYEAGTLYILSKCLQKGNTYLDIGSNLGLMALYASKCVGPNGKVFAFEPEPGTFKLLKQNITLNGFTNVQPIPLALGSAKNTAMIFNSQTNSGAASLIPSKKLTGQQSKIQVETLDDFICEKPIRPIRMIKIDVEGWELEVLKGGKKILSRADAPILCVECSKLHPMYGGTTEDIYTFVSDINHYQIYRLARGKERASKLTEIKNIGDLPKHDNLFCFLPDHKKTIDKRLFIYQ